MSLSALLPRPTRTSLPAPDLGAVKKKQEPKKPKFQPPAYGQRKGFIPRTVRDFGDGGSFPEIHVTQYPLDMGRKDKAKGNAVALEVDEEGKLQYDAVLRNGDSESKQIIYSQHRDLIRKHIEESSLERPSEDEIQETTEKTRAALGKLIDRKIAAAQPTSIKKQPKSTPTYVRYTPSTGLHNDLNTGSKQRIIRIQEMPVDPLEPPKFKHQKLPPGQGSPPPPVVHSPPRKITVQDQQNWKIPPCISNWKNIKGYTIPLDKRLAADGRGLQEVQVNSKFASLSESLYHAEQNARKEIEARAQMQQQIMRRKKQAREEELRQLAAQARAEASKMSAASRAEEDEDAVRARDERDEMRRDRKRDMRRELRMQHMGEERKAAMKARRAEERDVSEQIALGKQPKMSKEQMFDQRLFNQDQGMSQGFGAEDSYNLYDKPLFKGSSANRIYRPKQNADDDIVGDEVASLIEKSTNKFKPDRGFKGADQPTGTRDKPVAFEKEAEADPFGMGDFFSESKKRKTLDGIGKQGRLAASGGASKGQEYSRKHESGRSVNFEEGERTAHKRRK